MNENPLNIFILKSLPAFNFDHKMRLNEYDLNAIIRELEGVLPEYIGKGVKVETELSDGELKILADPLRAKEAFVNIIKNANDAMPAGGILRLSSKLEPLRDRPMNFGNDYLSDARALFSISDTGAGMDDKTREKIYEPFFTTKEGTGRGLGFPIASYIIQMHRGDVRVDSAPSAGTTVNIYFPLLKNDLLRPSPIPLPASFMTQDNSMYGKRF